MRIRLGIILLALFGTPAAARAQHGDGPAMPATVAPREASQFDFLVGQWDIEVQPVVSGLAARIHGVPKMGGTWKASRALDGWGVEDDLRIIDASGNPRAYSHAVRVYDATGKRWSTTALDVYRGSFTSSTSTWKNGEMTAIGRSTDKDGKPQLTRSRYYEIKPTSFRMDQERSTDNGRTWTEVLRIQAKRSAATARR